MKKILKTILPILLLPFLFTSHSLAGGGKNLFLQILNTGPLYDKTFMREMTVYAGSESLRKVHGREGQPDFNYEFKGIRFRRNRSSDGIWKRSKRSGPGRCPLKPVNVDTVPFHSGEDGGYLRLGIPAGKNEGGELVSVKKDFHFGIYEIRMKPSSAPGAVNAFFIMNPEKKGEEIDIEFLTDEFNRHRGKVHFVVHPRNNLLPPKYHRIARLNFNPADDFHTYGFIWTKKRIDFTIDGKIITGFSSREGSPVKSGTGNIHLNTWTGNPKWGGGPPSRDSWMIVRRISYWKM